jgi:hypothetical protein
LTALTNLCLKFSTEAAPFRTNQGLLLLGPDDTEIESLYRRIQALEKATVPAPSSDLGATHAAEPTALCSL